MKPENPGKAAYLTVMISLASAAFGVVAALAWNDAITALFKKVIGKGNDIAGLFVYAAVVTVIAVLVMVNLANAAKKLSGEQ